MKTKWTKVSDGKKTRVGSCTVRVSRLSSGGYAYFVHPDGSNNQWRGEGDTEKEVKARALHLARHIDQQEKIGR